MDPEWEIHGPLEFTIRIVASAAVDLSLAKAFEKDRLSAVGMDVDHLPGIGDAHEPPALIGIADGHVGGNVMKIPLDLVFIVFDLYGTKYTHRFSPSYASSLSR
jgi:hypothetical protein